MKVHYELFYKLLSFSQSGNTKIPKLNWSLRTEINTGFNVPAGGGLVGIEVHTSHSDYVYVWVNGQTIAITHGPNLGYCELDNITVLLAEGDTVSWTAGEVDYAYFIPCK